MTSVPKHPIFVTAIAFSKGALLTVPRTEEPYKDFFALPEGPVKRGEQPEQEAIRVLRNSSGLTGTKMKLIGVHDSLERVEKTRTFLFTYLAMQWTGEIPLEGVRWMSNWRSDQLAFEHNIMVLEADSVLETAIMSRQLYAIK